MLRGRNPAIAKSCRVRWCRSEQESNAIPPTVEDIETKHNTLRRTRYRSNEDAYEWFRLRRISEMNPPSELKVLSIRSTVNPSSACAVYGFHMARGIFLALHLTVELQLSAKCTSSPPRVCHREVNRFKKKRQSFGRSGFRVTHVLEYHLRGMGYWSTNGAACMCHVLGYISDIFDSQTPPFTHLTTLTIVDSAPMGPSSNLSKARV